MPKISELPTKSPATVAALQAVLGIGTSAVTNASVTAAVSDDPATVRTALGLGTAATTPATDYATAAQGAKADSALQPGGLAAVATTGAYSDLTGKPALGTAAAAATTDFDAAGAAAAAQAAAIAAAAADATTKANAAQSASEPTQTAASQAEAEAGTGTTVRSWTPLRIWQAITAKLTLGTWISGATGKVTPVDADTIPLSDSAASSALKSLTLANLKATLQAALKIYFDTLYSPLVLTKVNALTSSAGVLNIDWSLGDYFTITLTENVTSVTHTNLPAANSARTVMVRIQQHATAAKTFAMPAAFKWAGGTVGVISTGVGAVDVLALTTFNQGTTFNATLAKAFA